MVRSSLDRSGFETNLECFFRGARKMFNRFKRIASSIILMFSLYLVFLIAVSWSADNKSYQNISLDQFVKMFEKKDFILINVHIPYQGEIPDTELPKDKDAKILVYCMTGPMGYIAAEKLMDMGYTRVIHFEGGMKAWVDSGRQLRFRRK
jgi:rhodanese-related sulfurtransferase